MIARHPHYVDVSQRSSLAALLNAELCAALRPQSQGLPSMEHEGLDERVRTILLRLARVLGLNQND